MRDGLVVYFFTERAAEEYVRRAYNVPDHVGLGWTPYRIIVRSAGGTLAHSAYHTVREFRRFLLGHGYSVALGAWRHRGFRGGKIIELAATRKVRR